jgi:hypothetical protein
LIQNLGKKSVLCHFCNILKHKKKNSTINGCIVCKKGFHVNCFAAYHYEGALVGAPKILAEMIISSKGENYRGCNKPSKYVGTIADLTLTRE